MKLSKQFLRIFRTGEQVVDRLMIGKTLEGFGFYGTPIYDRPILLKLERHGTVVCEVGEMIDHFEFLVWKNPVSKEITQNVEEQYAGWRFFREGKSVVLLKESVLFSDDDKISSILQKIREIVS